jgi:chemotaxis protein histidine kinase CheA
VTALAVNEDLYDRLLPVFLAEVAYHLGEIDAAILQLAHTPEHPDALAVLARSAHTIKGNAAAMAMRGMVLEAQRLEWWVGDANQRRTPAGLAALHDARRALRRLLDEAAADADYRSNP